MLRNSISSNEGVFTVRKSSNPFRSEVTQARIRALLRETNAPLTITEIAEALELDPAHVAGNLGELLSRAQSGDEDERVVRIGGADTNRYEIQK
jgi:translation initiation factor 2 beta subunit (eIF-2beta)/eIF-5